MVQTDNALYLKAAPVIILALAGMPPYAVFMLT